ncbi:hypothetical protein CYLTODRAFT_443417 [Cylindrobasidium torrendii FP15055 ss-10]|uniref:F-box domain-containing protein n=1 Tax=Cylindrobasidium torrendii FP15055 ss-10 TaxID=1314674 RepID=A0A0D7BFI5_9AGAR|nr:hypothetical protein CYLTODRAFT_443417 [Cylindrobasidium torrendii FP15055 ss-10]
MANFSMKADFGRWHALSESSPGLPAYVRTIVYAPGVRHAKLEDSKNPGSGYARRTLDFGRGDSWRINRQEIDMYISPPDLPIPIFPNASKLIWDGKWVLRSCLSQYGVHSSKVTLDTILRFLRQLPRIQDVRFINFTGLTVNDACIILNALPPLVHLRFNTTLVKSNTAGSLPILSTAKVSILQSVCFDSSDIIMMDPYTLENADWFVDYLLSARGVTVVPLQTLICTNAAFTSEAFIRLLDATSSTLTQVTLRATPERDFWLNIGSVFGPTGKTPLINLVHLHIRTIDRFTNDLKLEISWAVSALRHLHAPNLQYLTITALLYNLDPTDIFDEGNFGWREICDDIPRRLPALQQFIWVWSDQCDGRLDVKENAQESMHRALGRIPQFSVEWKQHIEY